MTSEDIDHRWQRHEILLSALGVLTTLAVAARGGPTATSTLSTAAATATFCLLIRLTTRRTARWVQKCRYVAAFVYVLWFYKAVEFIVPALRNAPRDATLLIVDEQLFGVTLSIPAQAWTTVWLNELMSGCYLTYLVYLHVSVIHSWWMPLPSTRNFARWIYSVYALGLAGYILCPAVGPEKAFREFYGPDLQGPVLTPLNRWIVDHGSSVYDCFPSLHVLITCALIEFDRRNVRRRFYWMILPAIGLVVSTIYLRYHYVIDLVVGGLLFVVARLCFQFESGEVGNVEARDIENGDRNR